LYVNNYVLFWLYTYYFIKCILIYLDTFNVAETDFQMVRPSLYLVYLVSTFQTYATAKGVLIVFLYKQEDDNIDFSRSWYFPVSKELASDGIYRSLPEGTYRMQSYDIDANNLIQGHGGPAHVSTVHVNGSREGPTFKVVT